MVGLGAGDVNDVCRLTPGGFERPTGGRWLAEDLRLRGDSGDGWF